MYFYTCSFLRIFVLIRSTRVFQCPLRTLSMFREFRAVIFNLVLYVPRPFIHKESVRRRALLQTWTHHMLLYVISAAEQLRNCSPEGEGNSESFSFRNHPTPSLKWHGVSMRADWHLYILSHPWVFKRNFMVNTFWLQRLHGTAFGRPPLTCRSMIQTVGQRRLPFFPRITFGLTGLPWTCLSFRIMFKFCMHICHYNMASNGRASAQWCCHDICPHAWPKSLRREKCPRNTGFFWWQGWRREMPSFPCARFPHVCGCTWT